MAHATSAGVTIGRITKDGGPMEIIDRLNNWGRFMRYRHPLGCCGSAEKAYRAPWRQWVPLSEINTGPPANVQDAWVIEMAWRRLRQRRKMLLKAVFILRAPDQACARMAKIKIWHVETELRRAVNDIEERLNG